jgi:hypothetical protein
LKKFEKKFEKLGLKQDLKRKLKQPSNGLQTSTVISPSKAVQKSHHEQAAPAIYQAIKTYSGPITVSFNLARLHVPTAILVRYSDKVRPVGLRAMTDAGLQIFRVQTTQVISFTVYGGLGEFLHSSSQT